MGVRARVRGQHSDMSAQLELLEASSSGWRLCRSMAPKDVRLSTLAWAPSLIKVCLLEHPDVSICGAIGHWLEVVGQQCCEEEEEEKKKKG